MTADLGMLANEKAYAISGFWGTLLELCGFHIRIYKPTWLAPEYPWLVAVQHHYEDEGSTVLIPLNPEDEVAYGTLINLLLQSQAPKLPVVGMMLASVGGSHEAGVTELDMIRQRKESAIIAGEWETAADLRDQERAYVRSN